MHITQKVVECKEDYLGLQHDNDQLEHLADQMKVEFAKRCILENQIGEGHTW